jgi:hypothetical protein
MRGLARVSTQRHAQKIAWIALLICHHFDGMSAGPSIVDWSLATVVILRPADIAV